VTDYDVIVKQFLFRDFTVLKVMFTAIVVGGVGVFVLHGQELANFHIKPATMLAVILGAVLFGIGMVIYGYCPGTGIAAIGAGKLDALVGFAGMIVGGALYAFSYDWIAAKILPVGDLGKVQVHRRRVAERQDQPRRLAFGRADRAEDVCGLRALIVRGDRPRAAQRPAPRDLVLLANPRFVLEPNLYRRALRESCSDLCKLGGKAPFLKASSASSFWAWWRGRASRLRRCRRHGSTPRRWAGGIFFPLSG
jgi:hypothetical protein